MFRLIYSILFTLPWWGYALLAVLLGNMAFGLWDTHQSRMAQAEAAIRQGPPDIVKVGEYNPRMRDTPFQEMRLAGFLRADLGVGQLDGTVPKTYLVLDGADRTGPVVAVLFVGSDDQTGLPDLVATANDSGLVVASGFRRTLDGAEVAGQLRLQGMRREVVLMEAMVGNRTDVLRDKGNGDLPFVILVGGLAAASALMALYKRNRSRNRTQGKRRFRQRTDLQAAVPKPAATAPMPPQPTPQSGTPWGGAAPAPQPTNPAPASTRARPLAEDMPPIPTEPAFKSVFPGGGSGFRFKSADEIILQSFGTISRLTPPSRDDK